jgi:hypothetical protein
MTRLLRTSNWEAASQNVNPSMNAKVERVRHHLSDGWPILLLLAPTPILLHPEADLERQEDDRHSEQEDATDRDEIERSIVSHSVPDQSARGRSCGHHLNAMVLPIAGIER